MKGLLASASRNAAAFVTAVILAWASGAPAAAAGLLPGAVDLAATGRAMTLDGAPLVVLYSQDNCGWCDRARSQLVPMSRQPDIGARFAQIDIDRASPLTDFAGRSTTHGRFARDEGIRFTPMLVIYGPSGERLTEPLVGMGAIDFYAQQVAQAIGEARARLALARARSAALQDAPQDDAGQRL